MFSRLDTHYHFDFIDEGERLPFLRACTKRGLRLVAQTLLPSYFHEDLEWAANARRDAGANLGAGGDEGAEVHWPAWSLGLHPWYIEEAYIGEELELFGSGLEKTRLIGEVGLDFAPRRLEAVPAQLQVEVFSEVVTRSCEAAVHGGVHGGQAQKSSPLPHVLSIHAVRAASTVLDLLEGSDALGRGLVPVFHRFSGTSDDLTRLIRMGGYISINPAMLTSKRGRAYIRQVPEERLLVETDLPAPSAASKEGEGEVKSGERHCEELDETLNRILTSVEELRKKDPREVLDKTQERLYRGFEGPSQFRM